MDIPADNHLTEREIKDRVHDELLLTVCHGGTFDQMVGHADKLRDFHMAARVYTMILGYVGAILNLEKDDAE
jgi:hypothetical protein